MSETRKIAAILVSDVVGYSRLAGADEKGALASLRTLRNDLVEPTVAAHHGRFVKSTGDGALVEFRSVVDSVRCALAIQTGMADRNVGVPRERRIVYRIGIHLGDVVEESDGDLMGDGVNIAARLEGICRPGAICLSEDAYRQVKTRLKLAAANLGKARLKNIAEPIRAYSVEVGKARFARPSPLVAAAVWLAALIALSGGLLWFGGEGRPPPAPAATLAADVSTVQTAAPEPARPVHQFHRSAKIATWMGRSHAPPTPDPAPTEAAADPSCTFAYVACRNAALSKLAAPAPPLPDPAPNQAAPDAPCTFAYVNCRNAVLSKLVGAPQPIAMAVVVAPPASRDVACRFGDGTCRSQREAARAGGSAQP